MSTETLDTTYGITGTGLLPVAESTNPYGLSSETMTESVGESTSLDPLLPLATKVDFSYQPLTSYTMDSSNASSQVSDGGSTLKLSNTASKKVDFIYNVTANTVLQFEFRSDAIGKVSAIGFDNDNNFWNTNWSNSTGFKLSGSDQWTGWNQALNNYTGTEWRT